MAYYYTSDHLGSTREVCNSSGAIVARYGYDPYGRATLVSGTNLATFQYTGDYYHATSGLNLTLYRAYDPNTARWLSRDPLATPALDLSPENGNYFVGRSARTGAEMIQGPNLYAYVLNDPIAYIDPAGLGFVDCPKWLAELAAAEANLARRVAENLANPDSGHDKAILQARNRVVTAREMVAKHCTPDPNTCKVVLVTTVVVGGAVFFAPETGGGSLIILAY